MRTIAWDVDDVLNELMREWFLRAHVPAHPTCKVAYDELAENPPHRVLGIAREDYLASLDEFRLKHAASLDPCPEVLDWFSRRGDAYRHVALTSTPLVSAPISAAWVMRHFGRWIRTFACIPSPRPNDTSMRYDASKRDYLAWLGRADVFIDDSPSNLWFEGAQPTDGPVASDRAEKRVGTKVIMYPRPWNARRLDAKKAALDDLDAALR